MHARTYKEGRMAVAVTVRNLVSRTLDRRRRRNGRTRNPAAAGAAAKARVAVAGCFSVYVGAGRERFVVPVERANHPLFRRLLDDAELEYGYAAQGPIALPGCDVGVFLDVMWQMEHEDSGSDEEDDDDRIVPTAMSSSPMCGLIPRSGGANGGRGAGGYYWTLSPKSRSSSLRWWQ